MVLRTLYCARADDHVARFLAVTGEVLQRGQIEKSAHGN